MNKLWKKWIKYKLCYVETDDTLPRAWFCDKDPTEVTGDDWDDAPYEHNASEPYFCHNPIRLVFDPAPNFLTPGQMVESTTRNSVYSVDQINRGDTPWLEHHPDIRNWDNLDPIYAGTTLEDFINHPGVQVYVPIGDAKGNIEVYEVAPTL
jgi:hypothetical protein